MKIRLKECANVVDLSFNKIYDVEKSNDHSFMVIDDVKERNWIDKEECKIIQSSVVEEPKDYPYPPVGTVCEYSLGSSPKWFECEIKYYLKDFCGKIYSVVFYNKQRGDQVDEIENIRFRPIKSEKQKEIDKIASELLESVNKHGQNFKHLEGPIAEHLYSAGLRFTKDSK